MLAYRRDDVRDLNDSARVLLTRAGRLGPDTLQAGEREFQVGDRVICRRNDERLGVRNGIRAVVRQLDETSLGLRTDSGAVRSVDAAYAAEHLEHAYALTGHAAQGATVERAFVLLPDRGDLREWGYVACTRARNETRLYLAQPAAEPDAHPRHHETPALPDRAARALSRSAAQQLALERAADRTAMRLLEHQRQHLEHQRARSEHRLAAARAELEQLGWRGRRKRGLELRTEIAREEKHATARRPERAQLTLAVQDALQATSDADKLSRARSLRPGLPARRTIEREPPGLGLEL